MKQIRERNVAEASETFRSLTAEGMAMLSQINQLQPASGRTHGAGNE